MKKTIIVLLMIFIISSYILAEDTIEIDGFTVKYESIESTENGKKYIAAAIIMPTGAYPFEWECEIDETNGVFSITPNPRIRQTFKSGMHTFLLEAPRFEDGFIVAKASASYPSKLGGKKAIFPNFKLFSNGDWKAEFKSENKDDLHYIKLGGWIANADSVVFTNDEIIIVHAEVSLPRRMSNGTFQFSDYHFKKGGVLSITGTSAVPNEIQTINGFTVYPESVIMQEYSLALIGAIVIPGTESDSMQSIVVDSIILGDDGFIKAEKDTDIDISINELVINAKKVSFQRNGFVIVKGETEIDNTLWGIEDLVLYPDGMIQSSGKHDSILDQYLSD